MRYSACLPSFRRHPAMLLALGLLAVFLHLLADRGMLRLAPDGGITIELCTSHGLVKVPAGPGSRTIPAGAAHDCCKSCGTGAAALVPGGGPAVAPAPTFHGVAAWTPGVRLPQAPRFANSARGPPAKA